MSLYFGSLGAFINTLMTVLLIISIGIGIYLIFIWKNFNEKTYKMSLGTPAEIHFQTMTPTHYLIGQIIVIAIAIMWLNIIGAIILLLATPYIQKLSLERLGLEAKGMEAPKTREVNFDD